MTSRLLCLLVVLSAVLSACGPIRSTAGLVRADQALAAARDMGAEKHAPYAMTLAQALRDKAWEEQGYGEYDTSTNMAQEAETLARDAMDVTRKAVASVPEALESDDLFGEDLPAETPVSSESSSDTEGEPDEAAPESPQ